MAEPSGRSVRGGAVGAERSGRSGRGGAVGAERSGRSGRVVLTNFRDESGRRPLTRAQARESSRNLDS
ncbi:hypothetical protein ACFPRL_22725 [Pseudoclavibacter helvolus]